MKKVIPTKYVHPFHTVGPSLDPSGVNIVDAIIMYGQTKTAFGWPEHVNEPQATVKSPSASSSSQIEEEENSESLPVASSKPLSHLGRFEGREES